MEKRCLVHFQVGLVLLLLEEACQPCRNHKVDRCQVDSQVVLAQQPGLVQPALVQAILLLVEAHQHCLNHKVDKCP
jgi:hypothetical protein